MIGNSIPIRIPPRIVERWVQSVKDLPVVGHVVAILVIGIVGVTFQRSARNNLNGVGARCEPADLEMVGVGAFFLERLDVNLLAGLQRDDLGLLGSVFVPLPDGGVRQLPGHFRFRKLALIG